MYVDQGVECTDPNQKTTIHREVRNPYHSCPEQVQDCAVLHVQRDLQACVMLNGSNGTGAL